MVLKQLMFYTQANGGESEVAEYKVLNYKPLEFSADR